MRAGNKTTETTREAPRGTVDVESDEAGLEARTPAGPRKKGNGKSNGKKPRPIARARGATTSNGRPSNGKAANGKATNGKAANGKAANGKAARADTANGHAPRGGMASTRPSKLPRRLPVVDHAGHDAAIPPGALPRRRASGSGLDLQLQIAGFLRVVDRMVSAMVNAYDSIFVVDKTDQGEICFDAGLRFASEGRIPEAMEALRKSAHLLPDDPAPLLELGALHLRRKAPAAAIQALEKSRDLGNTESRLHLLLADAYLEEDRVADAVQQLETAFASHLEDPELAYRLGLALDRHGNHAEAVEAFALAVELEPSEIRYLQSLGFAHESLGQREEAVDCFKRALELEHREDVDAAQ